MVKAKALETITEEDFEALKQNDAALVLLDVALKHHKISNRSTAETINLAIENEKLFKEIDGFGAEVEKIRRGVGRNNLYSEYGSVALAKLEKGMTVTPFEAELIAKDGTLQNYMKTILSYKDLPKNPSAADVLEITGSPMEEKTAQSSFTTEKNGDKIETGETDIIWCNKAHANKTPGHWETIVDTVQRMKDTGDYAQLYINKGLRNVDPDVPINRRPDIIAVRWDGTVEQVEILSKTDNDAKTRTKVEDNKKMLGDRGGKTATLKVDEIWSKEKMKM